MAESKLGSKVRDKIRRAAGTTQSNLIDTRFHESVVSTRKISRNAIWIQHKVHRLSPVNLLPEVAPEIN